MPIDFFTAVIKITYEILLAEGIGGREFGER